MHEMFILVRHGLVEGIEQPRFRGRQHLQLTPAGLKQVERSAAVIGQLHRPDAVVTSPLTRCITTAAVIGRATGLAPEPDEGLIDLDYGEWQGRLHSEVREQDRERAEAWFTSPATATVPGGETLRALSNRAVEAFERIVARSRGRTVVVVAHDTVNRVILLHVLGLPLERYTSLRQDPACLNMLQHDSGTWTVGSINETAYLLPERGGSLGLGRTA